MQRAISSILIVLLLSQSLVSVPHSHAESSIGESGRDAVRPHIHLHETAHHHGHGDSEEAPSAPLERIPDHDSDAVYAGDSCLLNDVKDTKIAKAELSAIRVNCDESAKVAVARLDARLIPPLVLRFNCALYLQLLSIRC